eukprot:195909_1
MKYKSVPINMTIDNDDDDINNKETTTATTTTTTDNDTYSSMTSFVNKLKGYNRIKLLNDYYHIRKYHMLADADKELYDYIKSKVPNCNDIEMCSCCTRNKGSKQVYRSLSNQGRRDLYCISDSIKDGSESEMNEIALIEYLDIVHCLFIHNLSSDGKKFITQIVADRKIQNDEQPFSPMIVNGNVANGVITPSTTTATRRDNSDDSKEASADSQVVDHRGGDD